MRLLHTADWHLGRQLHGHDLVEDQRHALLELLRIAAEARVDALVVAGDVFDRAVPPVEAVELLDEVLARLALELRLPTLVIAGNHDNPARLAFGARLFRDRGLVVVAGCAPGDALVLADRHGPVELHGLAYAEPAGVRAALGAECRDHEAALAAQIGACRREPGRRAVLAAHAFVVGGEGSQSERPLTVGGAGTVPAAVFEGFAYVALGHLHAPQALAEGRVRYSGSLLKYSQSEAGHAKSVCVVEIDGHGRAAVEVVALPSRRDLRVLRGTLDELLRGPRTEDYVVAEVTDAGALFEPMARLREVYPRLLTLTRPAIAAAAGGASARADAALKREVPELFADFFAYAAGRALEAGEARAFADLWAAFEAGERAA